MLNRISLCRLLTSSLLVALWALATAAPALAASQQVSDRICTGDNLVIASGETVNNVLAFGCNVTVSQGASVQGDISAFGGNVLAQGTVNGSITVIGGNITVEETGVVNGNLSTLGGNISTMPGATVGGNITSTFSPPRPLPVPPVPPVPPAIGGARPFRFGFDLFGSLVTALAFAALGALIVIFAPEPTRRVSNAVVKRPWGSAGVGCLTLILLPVLCILLTITVIGLPVALILGLIAIVGWIFGWIAIGYLAGERILQALRAKDILPVVAVVLGVIILMLVSQIPVIGWLVWLIVGLLGIGAVVLTRFGTRAYPPTPGMVMTPAAAAPAAPGTFTPSAVDIAAWQARASQAQANEQAASAPPAEPTTNPPETPPGETPPSSPDKPTS